MEQENQRVNNQRENLALLAKNVAKRFVVIRGKLFVKNVFDQYHMKCQNIAVQNTNFIVCSKCLMTVLPFATCHDKNMPYNGGVWEATGISSDHRDDCSDTHLDALTSHENQLRFMHINTQSMVSTFDQLLFTINCYPFDIIAMSET